MGRLNDALKLELQPRRLDYAIEKITDLGYDVIIEDETKISFVYRGQTVHFFPYTGWHTGKSINDGRGIKNLLNQIK